MAISEQVISTLIEAVAALNGRFNDLSKLTATPGPQGERGPQGEKGEPGRTPSDGEIKAAAAEWLAANITQPADGEPGPAGPQGERGEPGPGPTETEIRLAVEIWFQANADQLRGPAGPAGPAGADGSDGRDGIAGAPGPVGPAGPEGPAGVGIASIEQGSGGQFTVKLDDGREYTIKLPKQFMSGGGGRGKDGVGVPTGGLTGEVLIKLSNADYDTGWQAVGGLGTVTSVAVSGGTTGLTTSGGPITTAGTITLSGTLEVDNGGTGATTAPNARTNLGAAASGANSDITSLSGITGGISTADYIDFDTAAVAAGSVGRLMWNDTEGTLEFQMKGGNVTLQIGKEEVVRVTNQSGSGMVPGQAVYITGSTGNHLNVTLAQANMESTSSKTIAVIDENIANNSTGFATTSGIIRGIDTSALTEGAAIWLSPTVPGGLTTTKPQAPDHAVLMGWCVTQSATVGAIYVHIANGYEVNELHDVKITGTPAAGSLLVRNATASLWENALLTSGAGITITNADKSITISSEPRVSNQTTVTSPLAWNSNNFEQYCITAQASALTINADAGTPTNARKMIFRIKDDGVARALTWTTGVSKGFRPIGVTLPTTTIAGKTLYIGSIYNSASDTWDVIGLSQEA